MVWFFYICRGDKRSWSEISCSYCGRVTRHLRLFSTRRNFPRAAQFFFVFFPLVQPESTQTKKNCAARGKFRPVENSLYCAYEAVVSTTRCSHLSPMQIGVREDAAGGLQPPPPPQFFENYLFGQKLSCHSGNDGLVWLDEYIDPWNKILLRN